MFPLLGESKRQKRLVFAKRRDYSTDRTVIFFVFPLCILKPHGEIQNSSGHLSRIIDSALPKTGISYNLTSVIF